MKVELRSKKDYPGEYKLRGETTTENPDAPEFEWEGFVFKLHKPKKGRPQDIRFIYINEPLRRIGWTPTYAPGPFYVYSILCPKGTMYVGATNDLRTRANQHRRKMGGGLFLCVLHVTDAQNVKRLEEEEIAIHQKEWGAHYVRNRMGKSGYCKNIIPTNPLLTPPYQEPDPEFDPMNDPML